MGSVFSTTTRSLLSAETGIGKTHLGFALGLHMAAGRDFCHWKATRPCRVLVIDGEMPVELIQERLADAERRLGASPEGFMCLSRDDTDRMEPLDTEPGQVWINAQIKTLKPDFAIFDNLMSLTVGNLKEEEGWQPLLPFVLSLSKRRIGQLWINHTGIDKTRDYGTNVRQWQMDTVMLATKNEGSEADIAFRLEFVKARQRKPSNRADYEPVEMILDNDQWRTEAAKLNTKAKQPGKNQKVLLNCLDTVLATAGEPSPKFTGMPTSGFVASYGLWHKQCLAQLGQGTERLKKQAFKEAAEALINESIGKHGDYVWRIY